MGFFGLIFSGTKFCASILLPTEHTFNQSLEVKRGVHFDEKDHVDLCCRSFHKCDAHKNIQLNHTNDRIFGHCGCIRLFQTCLKNVNTSLSNEVAFFYSMNTTKCYTKIHPVIKCVKFESYPESKALFHRFVNSAESQNFFNRCSKYELNDNQPRQLQLIDSPLNYHGMSTNYTGILSIDFLIWQIVISSNYSVCFF